MNHYRVRIGEYYHYLHLKDGVLTEFHVSHVRDGNEKACCANCLDLVSAQWNNTK